MKKKLLIIHPALAPYRVDQFNAISRLFDLEVVFIFGNVWNHKFDQKKLLSQLIFKVSFLLKGPRLKGRVFRFGMYRSIRKINPDIVLGYEFSFSTQYLILLKRLGLLRQKIGTTIDDSIDICNNVQSKTRLFARKNAIKHLDYVVVLSTEVSEFYQKTFHLSESQIIISPILQDADRLRSKAEDLEKIANQYARDYDLFGKKVLLFVGRFISEKALPNFVDTIHSLLLEHKDLVLVLVGEGEEKQKLQVQITERQLEQKVFLPGRFEGEELYAWYLCASGFVLPSTYEPFGAVVNEALIFGLPIFCSKYAGASYLVSTGKGLLFDPLNASDTTNGLSNFLPTISPVGKIDLIARPSLMADVRDVFTSEWNKINKD
ncbi:MAG: glycosyltransferase [Paludibacter sp.]|nr:glycosyltransferase [Paludibacter sp.]